MSHGQIPWDGDGEVLGTMNMREGKGIKGWTGCVSERISHGRDKAKHGKRDWNGTWHAHVTPMARLLR